MIDGSTHQKTTTASKDLIIICVVAILVFALASVLDVFGMVAEWFLEKHEGLWPLDEIVTVLVLLAFAVGIFSLRRWRELRVEVTARKRLQEDLRKYQKRLEEKIQERAAELTMANEQLQREIPQRKLLEEALRDSEEKYRILVESATDMIYMIDGNHKVLSLNKAAAMLWSKEPHEIVGKSILDLFPEEIAAHYAKGLEEVFQTGRSRCDRTKMIVGGKESWISVSLSPVKDHEGRVAAVMGITRDITEQKQAEEEIRRLNEELEQRVIERTAQLQAANKKLEIQITERRRAEEALRESERHYRELADSINDVFFGFDKDLRYTYWNKASEKLTGIPAKDAIGKSLYELFPDTPQTRVAERVYLDVLRTQQSQTFVNEYQLGGKDFFFEMSTYPSRDGLSVFVKDITERKRAEEALREREARLRGLFETMAEGIVLIAPGGQIIQANPAAERILGLQRSEIESRNYIAPEWEILRPDGTPMPPEEMAGPRAMKEKRLVKDVMMGVKHLDGSIAWINVSAAPLMDEAGRFMGVVGTFADITARKRMEEVLRESEQRFRMVLESSTDNLYRRNLETDTYDYMSPAVERILGYSPEEILSMPLKSVVSMMHPDDIDRVKRVIAESMASDRDSYLLEYRFRHKDGQYRWLSDLFTVIRDAQGRPLYFVGNVRDITERKRAEETLRESEEKYRNLVERANDGIVIVQDGIVKFINTRLAEMRGVTAEEVIGTPFTDHIYPDELPEVVDRYKRRMAGEDVSPIYETALRCKDGSRIHAELNAGIVTYQGKPADLVIVRDITERKRAEETLRESEERFRSLVETTSDWVWEVDQNGVYTYVSPCIHQVLGYEPEGVLGKTPFDLMPPDEAQRVAAIFSHIAAQLEPFSSLENTNQHRDGRLVVLETSGVPFFDPDGTFRGYRGIDRDITERKQAGEALRRSEEQYRLITENTRDLICMLDQDGNFIYASPSFREALGCEPEELMGSSFFSLVHPDDRVPAARTLPRALFSQNGRTVELRYKHQNGEWRIFESVWGWIFDGARSPQRAVVVSRDVTERKRAEESLRISERKYKDIFDFAPVGIYQSTWEGDLITANMASSSNSWIFFS